MGYEWPVPPSQGMVSPSVVLPAAKLICIFFRLDAMVSFVIQRSVNWWDSRLGTDGIGVPGEPCVASHPCGMSDVPWDKVKGISECTTVT